MMGWLLNPWLLAGGALAMLSPIIIHLLNKRRYKTVDWAAMDFLMEADKSNRSRIRIEDLILLILRCIAMVLIGLLLSRPYRSLEASGGLLETVSYERIVILDDSVSMGATLNGQTVLQHAQTNLSKLLRDFAEQSSQDSLSLYLTSQPQKPFYSGTPLTNDTIDEIVGKIGAMQVSQKSSQLDDALLQVEESLLEHSNDVNRILYLISDMRMRDWSTTSETSKTPIVQETIKRLSEKTTDFFLVDVGDSRDANGGQLTNAASNGVMTQRTTNLTPSNLTIWDVIPQEKVLVAGVAARFEVVVKNHGNEEVRNLQVKFMAEDSIPLTGEIPIIAARDTASIPFTFTFAGVEDQSVTTPDPVSITVTISSPDETESDHLKIDNTFYFAARLSKGIPTLIVDGDPALQSRYSEGFFLQRALAPPGDILAGIVPHVVSSIEFESESLDRYQVIYLCNLDQVNEETQQKLETWVKQGGGLVIALGDQLFDLSEFNQRLYRSGEGLSPVEVQGIRGDESERTWVHFQIEHSQHDIVRVYSGDNNPFLESVKLFRWWKTTLPADATKSGKVSLLASFDDDEDTPAIVEKQFGAGRVLLLTTPVDREWGTWPQDPSYLMFMQDLTRYLAKQTATQGSIQVGEEIASDLDLSEYQVDVTYTLPNAEQMNLQPRAIEPKEDDVEGMSDEEASVETVNEAVENSESTTPTRELSTSNDSIWRVQSQPTEIAGIYRLGLTLLSGEPKELMFAANVDPTEGDLQRISKVDLKQNFQDSKVRFVTIEEMTNQQLSAAKSELWFYVLLAVGLVLCVEQFLGWLFGLHR